jgi:hypothetical protein
MAIVKEIEIRVTDQQAEQRIGKVNELFKQVDKSVEQTEQSTVSLRTELRNLQQQMASGKLSGAEFNQAALRAGQLRDAIGDANQRINVLASDTQKLDVALSVGSGLAGAFSAAQGSMALFGGESEDVQKAILKVQGSLAVLNGIQAVANTLNKDSALMVQLQTRGLGLLAVAQKAYSFAVGASTGFLKAFRIALISTGIGAIVVGVGLLVANFEKVSKWVTDLIDKFGGWRKVLMFVAPPIWAIVKALEALGIIDDEETSKAKKNAEERAKARDAEIKRLKKNQIAVGEYYDFEIAKAKAAGKDVIELERKKRLAIIETLKAINDELREVIKAGTATQEQIKEWNEANAQLKKLYQEDTLAQIEGQKKADEEKEKLREKARQAAEKRAEEAKRQREKELSEIKKQQEDLTKIQEDAERERNKKIRKLQQELEDATNTQTPIEKLRKEYEENLKLLQSAGESTLLLTAKFNSDMFELQQAENQLKIDEDRRAAEERIAIAEAEREAKLAINNAILDNVSAGINLMKQLGEKNKGIQKAALIADSAVAIAKIIMNTKEANLKAVAASPLTGGQPWVGINTVSGALGIASTVVATKKALSQLGGGSAGGGSIGQTGGGGGGQASAPSFNLVGDAGMNQIAQGQAGQQPVEAYVVAGNVTTAQSLNRNIINNATF